MLAFFKTILYIPIYNLLIFLVGLTHSSDVGLGLIGVTLIIRLAILPLSLSAVRTSRAMKVVEPQLKEIREKYKDDKETQAKETFALYKKYKIRPFASLLTTFIQLPVLICLYLVVRTESLYHVDTKLIYPFIHAPATLSPIFLGLFLVTTPNIILAVIAAAMQFVQAYYAIPVPPPAKQPVDKKAASSPESMQEEFGRAIALQARFVLPVVIGIVSYTSGAIALYFITSNAVMLLQELLARLFPHSAHSSAQPAQL